MDEMSVNRRSENPASPTCPETLKTGPQKNARSIFLRQKNLALSCVVRPPVAVAIAGLRARGVPRSRVGDFVGTLQVAAHVHAGQFADLAVCSSRIYTRIHPGHVADVYDSVNSGSAYRGSNPCVPVQLTEIRFTSEVRQCFPDR